MIDLWCNPMVKNSYVSQLSERTPREQNAIAFGLLAALILILGFGILAPLISWYDEMNVVHDRMIFNREKYAQITARSEAQIQELNAVFTAISANDLIYNNTEVSLSVAQFEGGLRAAIGGIGLSVNSLLPGLPEPSGNLWLLPATLEVSGHPSKFAELIYTFENLDPLIRIDHIEILANSDDAQTALLKAKLHSFHIGIPSDG